MAVVMADVLVLVGGLVDHPVSVVADYSLRTW
jgi:hypothetical protein